MAQGKGAVYGVQGVRPEDKDGASIMRNVPGEAGSMGNQNAPEKRGKKYAMIMRGEEDAMYLMGYRESMEINGYKSPEPVCVWAARKNCAMLHCSQYNGHGIKGQLT